MMRIANWAAGAAIAILGSGTMVTAQDTTMIVPEPLAGFSDGYHLAPAVRVGDLVMFSGMVGIQEGEGPEAIRAAIQGSFGSVQMILEEAGLTYADVIAVTTYHTDLQAQKEIFLEEWQERFSEQPYPAWTAVGVSELWNPDIVVEITVTARAQ